ncbi:MAG: PIN domain-containing protein [Chloroflexi bacterium]|nr:PIN domain-containing protein [Chloroflexota bacterium]
MRVVADTGPLVAAANKNDDAHELAATLVNELGPNIIVLESVIAEVDYLLRARVSRTAARSFLESLAAGEHGIAFLSPGVFRRAVQIDADYADFDLGFTDASVMAYAERHGLPILTFDFPHFRATAPAHGFWRLVVDEARYQEATRP